LHFEPFAPDTGITLAIAQISSKILQSSSKISYECVWPCLLARLCVENQAAQTELRIDGGYVAVAAMLRRSNDPMPSARAVGDAAALIVAGVGESALAARKAGAHTHPLLSST